MDIGLITTGAVGAVIGYLSKTAFDYFVQRSLAEKKARIETEKSVAATERQSASYTRQYYYAPLARSLERLLTRLHIAVNDLGGNYGYSQIYVNLTFAYELCCVCYWLERPTHDPRIEHPLPERHETTVREALTLLTGYPVYSQKKLATRIATDPEGFAPMSYDAFEKEVESILDVETVEDKQFFKRQMLDWYHERDGGLPDDFREGISKLTWMAIKCDERSTDNRI